MNHTNMVVDLSEFNRRVDFKQVKQGDILGVVHRATIGCPELRQKGDQTYKDQDDKYTERVTLAKEEGLLWGAYHYGLKGLGNKTSHPLFKHHQSSRRQKNTFSP